MVTTGLATGCQVLAFIVDLDDGLRIVTVLTQDELLDEAIQHVLQLVCIVRSIDNVALIFDIELGLSAELAAKVLCRIWNLKSTIIYQSARDRNKVNSHVGGLAKALAMSTMLGMTVLTPLPLPSTLA